MIARHEPVPAREISRHVELPVPLVTAVCNELRQLGVVSGERPTRLTPDGRAAFAGGLVVGATPCPTCDGRGTVLTDALAGLAAELDRTFEAQPGAKLELDQAHCTVDSKLRRVALLMQHGALDKRIVFIGDDDLTSLAVAHYARVTAGASGRFELTVVDVDTDLLGFVAAEAARFDLPITTVEHNLTEPLPDNLLGRFDMAFTDPPYTVAGAELFLSRAVTALAEGGGQHVFFAFGARRPDETNRVQARIAEMGLAMRSLVPNFNTYTGAGVLGGTSHQYHLRTTPGAKPVIEGAHTGALYTADSRAAVARPYQCASCKQVHKVGPGQRWTTIAQLKSDGCPHCHSEKFRPMPLGTR
ncbi:bis-aminopropyl spermidine synthase family protein [Actinokineospora enzanensis]|uniref:bis-aminopropyl spermidine synthase family protein n=1 Tax=Actinokineospora enzanensis TaxID=155975 RepID=UPI00036B7124|nr:bis-aminopropyl spermidine synthase family protein [Actinokineospora enzanensis]